MTSDDAIGVLAESFEQTEEREIGAGVHERYHQLAHRLGEV